MLKKEFDIKSGNSYPSNFLSNFAGHSFVFEGVTVGSMEGLIQSLKFRRWEQQAEMLSRRGMDAKMAGQKMSGNWKASGNLWWKETPIPRFGIEYQNFLDKAYQSLYDQCPLFRKALEDTQDMILTHKIGINNSKMTILTTDEFCVRLMTLRSGEKLWDFGVLNTSTEMEPIKGP